MCGRYAASKRADQLVEEFEVDDDETAGHAPGPDYNVAPTKKVLAVVARHPRADDTGSPPQADASTSVHRQLRVVRWGLVPSWAKDPSIGSRMINARVESAADKPAFRRAFARRRCLIPADGYYEWYAPPADAEGVELTRAGKPRKQPVFIRPRDGSSLAMAGLYEFWRDPTRPDDDPQAWLVTCTVLTTDAADGLGRIHDRMPVVVARDDWAAWLDPDAPAPAEVLRPATASGLTAYPVSMAVNDARSRGPELIDPLPAADVPGWLMLGLDPS